jgi:hypothetical protein
MSVFYETQREQSIRSLLATAYSNHPGNAAVTTAAARVESVLDNEPDRIVGPYNADSCFLWSTGRTVSGGWGQETIARSQHYLACTDWEAALEHSLTGLADALRGAGDQALGEVAGAAADEAETAREQAADVTNVSLWETTPGWLRSGGLLLLARELAELRGGRRG